MNNRDRLNAMTNEELAEVFCNAIDEFAGRADVDTCDYCPVRSICKRGHNGFLAWLNSDTKEDFIIK